MMQTWWSTGFVLSAVTSVLLLGCSNESQQKDVAVLPDVARDSVTQYSGNGAQIFYTGRTNSGVPISVVAPSALGDGTPSSSCVDCHGADGRGLDLRVTGGTLRTPNITYEVLTTPQVYRGNRAYTDATLGLTLRTGIRVDGYTLNAQMPRWDLSGQDMADLIGHLKSLSSATGVPR